MREGRLRISTRRLNCLALLALALVGCGSKDAADRAEESPESPGPEDSAQMDETDRTLCGLIAVARESELEAVKNFKREALIEAVEGTAAALGEASENAGSVLQDRSTLALSGLGDFEGSEWSTAIDYDAHVQSVGQYCDSEHGIIVPYVTVEGLTEVLGAEPRVNESQSDTFRSTVRMACNPEGSYSWRDENAALLEEIWEQPPEDRVHCWLLHNISYDDNFYEWEPTQDELQALDIEEAFDELDGRSQTRARNQVQDGYLRCGSSQFKDSSDEDHLSSSREIDRAMKLCPDHPEIDFGKERQEAAAAALEEVIEQRESGVRFGGGRLQVGDEVQPGSYYIEGNITDCYWETLDSAGNIMANNFVRSAQRVEAYISPDAYTFRSQGCGSEWGPL